MEEVTARIEGYFKEYYKGWGGAEQFNGSGDRLRRLVEEMCWPSGRILEGVGKCLEAVFKDCYDEMLVVKGIEVWTLCPHHLLPCEFTVSVGYIPNGKVLGLSKFARVAVLLGKRPVMQEMYTRELAEVLWSTLGPEGVGVYVIGRHGCMGCRGVKQSQSSVATCVLKGSFKEDGKVREEFYGNIR